jgi:hypothetical protein
LEVAAQAKAYLDVPILPKATGSGAIPAQIRNQKAAGPELPRTKWNRLNAELNQKGKAIDKNKADLDWHRNKQQQLQQEMEKHRATCVQLEGNQERLQAEWKEISEQAGQAKIAYDTALASKPEQEAESQDAAGILAKVNGCLDSGELAWLQKLLQASVPPATDRQVGDPCTAARKQPALRGSRGPVHGGYPAPAQPTLQQQVEHAAAANVASLPPAEETPLDTRFDAEESGSDTLPAIGEEEEEDIMEDTATKRKGFHQAGEACMQEDGTVAQVEVDSCEANSSKKARPAHSTGQELAEELAALEQQRAGLQEVAGSNGSGATPAHMQTTAASASAEQHSG